MKSLQQNSRIRSGIASCQLVVLLIVISLLNFNGLLADEELPELGENAAFNIEQEYEIGRKFYRHLLSRGLVETHPLLDRYLNDLGARLLSVLDHRVRDYRFFIVRDGSINAFALPGGYIGVNVGLILRAQSEHQLASVLAHEIAHVRLRHGLKLMEKAEGVNSAAIATILAGILAGGGDLSAALIYGGAAGSRQTLVNYTRDFEYEADRLGINLLQGAEFDGRGMVEFFRILGQMSGNSEVQNIEYLRTHPVSTNRISETEARLRPRIKGSSDIDYFPLFRDYLLYLTSDGLMPSGSQFRRALSEVKTGNEFIASDMLGELYAKDRDNIWFAFAYAENLEFIDRYAQAEAVYRRLLEIYPDDFVVSRNLMRLLKTAGQYDDALVIGRRLEDRYPGDKAVFFELVEIYEELDKTLLKLLAQADYHRLAGAPKLAIKLYSQVLGSPDIDLATESRVREKLAELNQ